jgi:hypothetical protein
MKQTHLAIHCDSGDFTQSWPLWTSLSNPASEPRTWGYGDPRWLTQVFVYCVFVSVLRTLGTCAGAYGELDITERHEPIPTT